MFKTICLSITLLISSCSSTLRTVNISTNNNYLNSVEELFIAKIATNKYTTKEIRAILKQAKYNPQVIKLINKPYEAISWHKYKKRIVSNKRINDGVIYYKKHYKLLKQLERIYKVPANIIVAIIAVETDYGNNIGSFKVIDSLYTLAFYYPKRSKFFRQELAQFIKICIEEKINPNTIYGSYAGAIGKTQFMPSSYKKYAVSFMHKDYPNIMNSDADALASIANYMRSKGWQFNKLIVVKLSNHEKHTDKVFNLDNNYWRSLNNFKVIMRYNHSINYAFAVFLLSQKIEENLCL